MAVIESRPQCVSSYQWIKKPKSYLLHDNISTATLTWKLKGLSYHFYASQAGYA